MSARSRGDFGFPHYKASVISSESGELKELLHSFVKGNYEKGVQTSFNSTTVQMDTVGDTPAYLDICVIDINGSSIDSKSISGSDVLLLCFSLVDEKSYTNIQTKLLPVLQSDEFSNTPKIIVGMALDKRTKFNRNPEKYKSKGRNVIESRRGKVLQAQTESLDYIECSAKDNFNITNVFEVALQAAIKCESFPSETIIGVEKIGGITYQCYQDKTAAVINVDENIDSSMIPTEIKHSVGIIKKSFIVTKFGNKTSRDSEKLFKWPRNDIKFPDDSMINYIGNVDFSELRSFTAPPKLQEVHPFAFSDASLSKIPSSILAFDGSNLLLLETSENAIIGKSVKIVRPYSCANRKHSINFEKSSTLKYIDAYAFTGSKIKELAIPYTCKIIGRFSFSKCKKLTQISFDQNGAILQAIRESAFYKSGLRSITIPASVKKICKSAFKNSKLTKIYFEKGSQLDVIEESAFYGTSIESITLPNSVKSVGKYCFKNCIVLKNFNVEEGSQLQNFSSHTFDGCDSIENIMIPSGICDCPSEVFASGSKYLIASDLIIKNNLLMTKDLTVIISYNPKGPERCTIPETVKEIRECAFKYCSQLKELTFDISNEMVSFNIAMLPESIEKIVLPEKMAMINGKGSKNNLKNLNSIIITNPGETIFDGESVDNWNSNSTITTLNSAVVKFYSPNKRQIKKVSDLGLSPKSTLDKSMNSNAKITIQPTSPANSTITHGRSNTVHEKNPLPLCTFAHSQEERNQILEAMKDKMKQMKATNYVEKRKPTDPIDFSKFKRIKKLGDGNFGTVFLFKNPENGKQFAIKEIKRKGDETSKDKVLYERETKSMNLIHHLCVIRMYGYSEWKPNDKACIALEYLSYGTLDDVIPKDNQKPKKYPNNTQKVLIFVGICLGMRYVHNMGIIHRDLKPENIFLDENFHVRIGDLGLAKQFEDSNSIEHTQNAGTPLYMAYEQMISGTYDKSVDVYAFGIISFYLLFGYFPLPNLKNTLDIIRRKEQGDYLQPPDDATRLAVVLVELMLKVDPAERPDFNTILAAVVEHDFDLLPKVNVKEVRQYYEKIIEFENMSVEEQDACFDDPLQLTTIAQPLESSEPNDITSILLDFNMFEMVKELFRPMNGSYILYLMKSRVDDINYNVKAITRKGDIEAINKKFISEIQSLFNIKHPCIVKFVGYCTAMNLNDSPKIVYENMEKGSFEPIRDKLFKNVKIPNFTQTKKAIMVVGICYGMRYLHKNGVMHRNLNPTSIFFTKDFEPKIGNFDSAKIEDGSVEHTGAIGSEANYAAPEMFNDGPVSYTNSIDVYSFGAILFELANSKPVFPKAQMKMFTLKTSGKHEPYADNVEEVTKIIIDSCMALNESERPTFDDIIQLIKKNNFMLFSGVNGGEVQTYCDLIESQETA